MLTLQGTGDPREIAVLLQSGIPNSGISCELVSRVERSGVVLLIFEKYYFRNSSRASLTVLISGEDGRVTVDAVASGAGNGTLFNFDWGAAGNFEDAVRRTLAPHGFS